MSETDTATQLASERLSDANVVKETQVVNKHTRVKPSKPKQITQFKKVKKIVVLPDLHLDDVYEGKHINYLQDCVNTMTMIGNYVIKEKPDMVILVGDIIGVRPGRSRLRTREFLAQVINFLKTLAPEVIALKANHDLSVDSDFDFLENTRTFKTTNQVGDVIDITPTDAPEDLLRLHLRDYGLEKAPLNVEGAEGGTNIVIAHNDFYIEGQEYRRHSDDAIDLMHQTQWRDADMILSGHIHTPSETLETFIPVGSETDDEHYFLNLGCPTRPSHSELYNQSWIVTLEFAGDGVWQPRTDILDLQDYHEIFTDETSVISDLTEQMDAYVEKPDLDLQKTINTLMSHDMQSKDIKDQIDGVVTASKEARDKAKYFIDEARLDL